MDKQQIIFQDVNKINGRKKLIPNYFVVLIYLNNIKK